MRTKQKNKKALRLILTYLSLSESLNQTIGSSPHNLMLLGQVFSWLFLVFVALLPSFKIPKHFFSENEALSKQMKIKLCTRNANIRIN